MSAQITKAQLIENFAAELKSLDSVAANEGAPAFDRKFAQSVAAQIRRGYQLSDKQCWCLGKVISRSATR